MGYANKLEDLKNHDQNRGILHTGDLAKKDNDNFYFIVGRKKDLKNYLAIGSI